MSEDTLTINGKRYDARTGLPVKDQSAHQTTPAVTRNKAAVSSSAIHYRTQKSATLNRRIAQKHTTKKEPIGSTHRQRASHPRSPAISKFAAHPVADRVNITVHRKATHLGPTSHHPLATKAQTQRARAPHARAHQPTTTSTSLQQALPSAKDPERHSASRLFGTASASLAILLLAGYVAYLNMPSISIRIAAAQSGIDASYPGYQPTGYRLSGPIAYGDQEVNMRFAANTGPHSFIISEKKTNWDSTAVLENYVKPRVDDSYVPHKQGGLTIFTYDTSAAWVNGGILYTIEGDAPLSGDQILRMASSL